mmetsp:Transcript_21129/g.38230  ORF Transcript_21129/g.38230 Transcript_21129/m.38230 type:complete len:236 (+) Transcript_21129:1461-2168(+)
MPTIAPRPRKQKQSWKVASARLARWRFPLPRRVSVLLFPWSKSKSRGIPWTVARRYCLIRRGTWRNSNDCFLLRIIRNSITLSSSQCHLSSTRRRHLSSIRHRRKRIIMISIAAIIRTKSEPTLLFTKANNNSLPTTSSSIRAANNTRVANNTLLVGTVYPITATLDRPPKPHIKEHHLLYLSVLNSHATNPFLQPLILLSSLLLLLLKMPQRLPTLAAPPTPTTPPYPTNSPKA